MLNRRSFLVTMMLFAVVFFMFMLVNVTTGVLTHGDVNPRTLAEIPSSAVEALITVWDQDAQPSPELASGHETAENQRPGSANENIEDADALLASQVTVSARPLAALIVKDSQSDQALTMREWCVYQKYRYRTFSTFPEPEALEGCSLILVSGDMEISGAVLKTLNSYADAGIDMVFTSLPKYEELAADEALRGFFGIDRCVSPDLTVQGFEILENFWLNSRRVYAEGDFYGKTDDDIPTSLPYYLLHPGYWVYAIGVTDDPAIDYQVAPPVLWRTYVGKANVFVINCPDVFQGKTLLGVLTAFAAQTTDVYLYPVVNARTVSLVNFPLLSDENQEMMTYQYSRTISSLTRDVLWPGIEAIMMNYGDSFNYFAAAEINGGGAQSEDDELLSFFRQDIAKRSGVLGIALDCGETRDFYEMAVRSIQYFNEAMPGYRFSAIYVPSTRINDAVEGLKKLAGAAFPTLLMANKDTQSMLLDYAGEDLLAVRFTSESFSHESLEDLEMVSILNALGMDNQIVDMKRVFYPEKAGDHWFTMNPVWAAAKTYLAEFEVFDSLSVHEMEDRVRAFLALNYTATETEEGLRLLVKTPGEEVTFVLRLQGKTVIRVERGSAQPLTDTAWLIKVPGAGETNIVLADKNKLERIPQDRQDVIAK